MWSINRPVARIDWGGGGGGAGPQKSGPFGPKVDFFEPHPLTLLQKPHFWTTLWLKVDLLANLGGPSHPPHPPGYGPVYKYFWGVSNGVEMGN